MARRKKEESEETLTPAQDGEVNNSPTFVDEARNAIFDKHEKFVETQLGKPEEAAAAPEPTEPTATQPDPAPEAPAQQLPAPDAPVQQPENAAAADSVKKYPLKVNGQVYEYTKEELDQIADAQKVLAAQQQFTEAAAMRQQAQQMMFSGQQQNSQAQSPANSQVQPAPTQSAISDEKLRDAAKKLNYGTEEESVQALRELLTIGINSAGNTPQPGFTPEQLVAIATQNALATLQAQQERDVLMSEFKDILADVPLAYATDIKANQLGQEYAVKGVQKTRLDLFREAGQYVRDHYMPKPAQPSAPNSPAPAPVVSVDPNRLERKRAAPQPPVAASAVNNAATPEEREITPREAFVAIARARGQHVAI